MCTSMLRTKQSSFQNVLKSISENYESEISSYRRQKMQSYLLALPKELNIRDPIHMQERERLSGEAVRLPSEFKHVLAQKNRYTKR